MVQSCALTAALILLLFPQLLLLPELRAQASQAGSPSSSAGKSPSRTETGQVQTPSGTGASAVAPSLVDRNRDPHGPKAYVIGIGDVLRVDVFGESQFDGSSVVRPDGKISLPLVSDVAIAGLTPVAAERLLALKLSKFVQNPKVTITVIEIHSRVVYITGEVFRPGAYALNDTINVVQLVARAGGTTAYAKKKRVYVLRADSGGRVNVDYRKVLLGQHVEENVQLNPGDTVVVP